MPICSPGTSQPKPGYARLVLVTAGAVEGALIGEGISRAASSAISGMIAGQTYDLSNICASDPPPDPSLTVDDFLHALNWADPTNYFPALLRIRQWFLHWYWYQVCECVGATTPSAPTLTVPTDINQNPGLPSGPSTGPCWDVSQAFTLSAGSGNEIAGVWNLGVFLMPGANTSGMTGNGAYQHAFPIPPGVTTCHVKATSTWSSFYNANLQFRLNFYNSSKALLAQNNLFNGSGTYDQDVAVPSGAAYWNLWQNTPAGSATDDLQVEFSFFCNGQSPIGIDTPCCPPDPSLMALVQQILGLVTLTQRQLAPFAYIDGAVHTGLTGAGSITVQGLLGARVTLTTIPAGVGLESGDPNVVFEAGWINFGDASGFSSRRFITASPIQFFPEAAGQYTRIGYTFPPGAVATITEIVRES